jgi:hypothetical protein
MIEKNQSMLFFSSRFTFPFSSDELNYARHVKRKEGNENEKEKHGLEWHKKRRKGKNKINREYERVSNVLFSGGRCLWLSCFQPRIIFQDSFFFFFHLPTENSV